ncbi:alpha/beta-hydrolase [Lyophyllum atratum]|nr:alpha/beta-hydrolase [Lyophyllum atratum]
MALPTFTLVTSALLSALFVQAAPVLETRQSFTTLSTTQIANFRPFTSYASSAYCPASETLTWSCGANCDANPTFQPIASGGDGDDVQFWYVGFDPTLKTVILGHQGTDPTKLMPLITDADFFLDPLDQTLFPGIDPEIEVHNGFAEAHAETAPDVLAAVKTALTKSGFKQVTIVGHSLGAALAVLNGVYLPLNIPGVNFRTIGYGMPRVGNQAFADYVDANVPLTRITNKNDVVPILPGRFLGFHHPQGENHIQTDNSWVTCPGQDNTDKRCTVGDVRTILGGSIKDHSGPYDTVTIGC